MPESDKKYPASVTLTDDGGRIVRTNCFECHSKCGVLVYVDNQDRVYKVTGNPEDPQNKGTTCGKAQAAKKILYHPERVNYPLKRVGEKGEGKWERISWDEAYETISSKLLAYKEEFGPEHSQKVTYSLIFFILAIIMVIIIVVYAISTIDFTDPGTDAEDPEFYDTNVPIITIILGTISTIFSSLGWVFLILELASEDIKKLLWRFYEGYFKTRFSQIFRCGHSRLAYKT